MLNSFPIPFDQSSLFLSGFQFLPNSSRLIEFLFFFKTNRNHISFLNYSFVFLSDSSLDLFSPKFFFVIFLGQRFKGFLQKLRVRHFCPFFLIKLHAFMHFSCFIFLNFRIIEKLGFLLFLFILVKTDTWVFVHASFKHDSHALISKFSWFINFFEVRVHMFLRDLGILLN